MLNITRKWLVLFFTGISVICINLITNLTPECPLQFDFYSNLFATRDLSRYKCVDISQIEGVPFCQNIDFHIDKCNILIFSSKEHNVYAFEKAVETSFKCNIETFDPFNEGILINEKRQAIQDPDAITIKMSDRWSFHRIGLSFQNYSENENKIGWLTGFSEILMMAQLKNEPIDLVFLEIGGLEWKFLDSLNMEYACSYFKQLVLVTHPTHDLQTRESIEALKNLEKCFRLFHRKSRFFDGEQSLIAGRKASKASYVEKETSIFKDEISFVNYLFAYGQLAFVNTNFVV